MALGRRSKTESVATPESKSPSGEKETFLDEGCSLSGVLRFAEDVRIDGRVEGEMSAQKGVIVGERAEIDATIEAGTLEVYGTVLGDIRVARRTTLHKTARVEGEIHTAGIVIEEGAHFKGHIVIGTDAESHAPARPQGVAPASGTSEPGPEAGQRHEL